MHVRENRADRPSIVFAITVRDSLILTKPVAAEFERRGWQTTIIVGTTGAGMNVDAEGFDLVELAIPRTIDPVGDARAIRQLTRYLRRHKPDVLVGSTPKAALLSLVSARISRVPQRVFLVRGARWDGQSGKTARLLRIADQVAARSASSVVAVSASLADLFMEKGVTRTRPEVLGAGGSKGVDLQRFFPRDRPDGRPPTIGFVGRISVDKGIRDVLRVHDFCMAQDPSTQLVVVGPLDPAQPPDPETTTRLKGPNITTHDYVPDPSLIISGFDVLVFPSIREGLPNVVIEAAACGVPTVGYDTTGVRDAVIPDETGILVPLGDAAGLARATLHLLSKGPDPLREECLHVARTQFAQEIVIGNFADYVEGLVNAD